MSASRLLQQPDHGVHHRERPSQHEHLSYAPLDAARSARRPDAFQSQQHDAEAERQGAEAQTAGENGQHDASQEEQNRAPTQFPDTYLVGSRHLFSTFVPDVLR